MRRCEAICRSAVRLLALRLVDHREAHVAAAVRLSGGFRVLCEDERAQEELGEFLRTVNVGHAQVGFNAFLDKYLDSLLTNGRAVGEIVPDADFVKTSTGFATPKDSAGGILPNGASAHHIEIMRKTVGKDFGVKASGGIRSAKKTVEMIAAGANRIGTSSGIQIIENWDESVKIPGWDD